MATITFKDRAEYNFQNISKDTTFEEKKITTSLNLTDVTIAMIWVNKFTGLSRTTTVTVGDGEFVIESFLCDWPAGVYAYSMLFNLPGGIKKKYIIGTMKVTNG